MRLVGRAASRDYFQWYQTIDVALDTFPYNGHTTTCDALWMGVPTVSLKGHRHTSRAGLSVLSSVDLGHLVAGSPTDYVSRAISLVEDVTQLTELRRSLRQRMNQSVLMDSPSLATRLEYFFGQSVDAINPRPDC